jgi:hypothetical protein
MVVVGVWADAGAPSSGKTMSNAAMAALKSPELKQIAVKKTERRERTNAAMAQAIPFPHKPVSFIEVHAPRGRNSSMKRPKCVLPVPVETPEPSYTFQKNLVMECSDRAGD